MATGLMVWAKKISSSSTSVVNMAIRLPLPLPASLAGASLRNAANALERKSASRWNATLWFRYCSTYRVIPRRRAQIIIMMTAGATPMPHTGLPVSANAAIMPNTGRKVDERWPMVPAVEATAISPASGRASLSSRLITWNVLILEDESLFAAPAGVSAEACSLPPAEAVGKADCRWSTVIPASALTRAAPPSVRLSSDSSCLREPTCSTRRAWPSSKFSISACVANSLA